MHVVESGSGPLVICCHGFPECWYSWRHQLAAIADAGFRVIAPDQRGYGFTTVPEPIDQYTIFQLVGDIVGLVQAYDSPETVVIGHDWGSPVAWNCALLRPDLFRAVVSLSVPYMHRGKHAPMQAAKELFGDRFFYQLYFQTPGVAEHELQHDVAKTLRSLLFGASGAVNRRSMFDPTNTPPASSYMLEHLPDPGDHLPDWLSQDDLDIYEQSFQHSGFRGGLNWYRNIDRNWELSAAFQGQKILQPALFITGEHDVVPCDKSSIERMRSLVPNLQSAIVLPSVGHWTQQEDFERVNQEIIAFLRAL